MIETVTARRHVALAAPDRLGVARRAALAAVVVIGWAVTTLMLAAAIMLADPATPTTHRSNPAPAPIPQPIEAPPGLGL